jgi:hypothetical protein
MNPENTSNNLTSPPSPAPGGGGGGAHPHRYLPDAGGEGAGFALAQQLQYQQLLLRRQQEQQQQEQQRQQQQAILQQNQLLFGGIGGGGSIGVGGGMGFSQRDPVFEQIAAAREQALRDAVLANTQPYSSIHASAPSLLQHPLPLSSVASAGEQQHLRLAGAGSSMLSVSAPPPQPSIMGLDAGTRGSFPQRLQHATASSPLPLSSQPLSREETRLVEEAVLRGLPIEQVFRAASSSSASSLQPGTGSLQQNWGLGGGGGGQPRMSSSSTSQLTTSMMDPSQVIAQRELLLATAAAGGGLLRGPGALVAPGAGFGEGPAMKRGPEDASAAHLAGTKKKKKPKRPSSASTASAASAARAAVPPLPPPRWLAGCAFPLPVAAPPTSSAGRETDDARGAALSPGPAKGAAGAGVVHVGALASYHKLWDRLTAHRRRKSASLPVGSAASAAPASADDLLRFQRELFRRRLASGAFPVEAGESRSAALLLRDRQERGRRNVASAAGAVMPGYRQHPRS